MGRIKIEYILVPLVAGLIAMVGCWFVASRYVSWPQYEATATLLIEDTPDSDQVGMSPDGISIAQNTVAALVVRDPLVSTVIANTGIDSTPEDLAERIRVGLTDGAPLVEVGIADSDPALAASLTNEIADVAAATRSPLVTTSVLSPAVTPTSPTLSSYILLAVAGVIGAQVGGGALALARRWSRRIRTADDVRERSSFPILGELDLRGDDDQPGSDTDRIVVAAFASSIDIPLARLLVVSPTETRQVPRLLVLLNDVFTKLRGDDHVLRDVVRGVAPADGRDSMIETVVVTRSVAEPEGTSTELRAWLDELPEAIEAPNDEKLVRLVQCPPLLSNLEVVLSVAGRSSTILVVQRDTTRTRDFELAVDFLTRSGTDVLGIFLVR